MFRKKPAKQKKRFFGLTWHIMAVNFITPLILGLGILYLDHYEESLIAAELDTMRAESRLFAGAIAEGTGFIGQGIPSNNFNARLSRRMVNRLATTNDSRTRLYDAQGRLIADSETDIMPAAPPKLVTLRNGDPLSWLAGTLDVFPVGRSLERFPDHQSDYAYENIIAEPAVNGHVTAQAWRDRRGNIILSAAAPVERARSHLGVVSIIKNGAQAEIAIRQMRIDVLRLFLMSLMITFMLSIYLATFIGAPLKKLARAAENVRFNHKTARADHTIPDMSERGDEIGELSAALRAMTDALWQRIQDIERFAADVAHEIKNPLTSLRSALESLGRVERDDQRTKLTEIMENDILRMDRLITDISQASRLDAELRRDEKQNIDLIQLLKNLSQLSEYKHTNLDLKINDAHCFIRGNEGRLVQVFQNLMTNALSFSPEGSTVQVSLEAHDNFCRVIIEDEGPGIPPQSLERIFERFYSERPEGELYGRHSGLGLAIAKQIIDAHNGGIHAENRKNHGGARFIVDLPR